ncbi:MAG TPA: polyamine aminopropyltransferase [Steroidobacteraceae bacterium]|nr:polyamine aminopropyltransferase [Steroidobacteraceae bacterium]
MPLRAPLLFSALIVASCGLVYELVAGTLASYLLGDSVTQFSTIIGAYLFSMGVGSWLSRYIRTALLENFVRLEIVLGLVGGCSAAILFLLFGEVTQFRVALYGLVGLIGVLVGLEIPLLLRILQDEYGLADLVARVFAADYVGALIASLLFPLLLVPQLGLIRTAFVFGLLNVAVAWLLLARPRPMARAGIHRLSAALAMIALAAGFAYGDRLMALSEQTQYPGQALFAKWTPYQRIVVTRAADDIRLFLNGNLQFSSRDEYRYHEALVHPIMSTVQAPHRVLVLGGGDGLAVREILKYPSVDSVTLVDLDPEVTSLFARTPFLAALNQSSLRSSKVHVINADAFVWLQGIHERFDAVIVDFPDPSNYSIGKLFSLTFYRRLNAVLSDDGWAVIQSTSPYVARKAFWCVEHTVQAAGLIPAAYHVFVPSFGEWGFVLAGHRPFEPPAHLPADLRYLTPDVMRDMFAFPPDMDRVPTDINRLDNQVLVRYFETEWAHYLAE